MGNLSHPNPTTATIYGRVSTSMQREGGTSLPGQRDVNLADAARRGWTLPEEYIFSDEGVSGKRYWTRPGIQAALGVIERKAARYLICETVDRAARKARIGESIAQRVWDAGGILVMNGIEFDGGSPLSCFQARLFFGLGELDYDTTRRKLDTGRRRAAMGMSPLNPYRQAMQRGTPPYGIVVPVIFDAKSGRFPQALLGRHVIVAGDQEQAERLRVVRLIHEMFDDGRPLLYIQKWLQNAGVRSPRGKSRWSDRSISYVLENEVYAGCGTIFKSEGRFDEKRETESGRNAAYRVATQLYQRETLLPVVLYDPSTGRHEEAEPVVAPDMKARVIARRAEPKKAGSFGGSSRLNNYLSHFGFCASCGARWSSLRIENESGVYTYYRCSGKYVEGQKERSCTAEAFPYMRADVVEAELLQILEGLIRDPSQIEDAITAYENAAYDGDAGAIERDRLIHEINRTLRLRDVSTEREMEAQAEGEDADSYSTKVREYSAALKTLRMELAECERKSGPQCKRLPARTRAEKLTAAIGEVREALGAGPEDATAEEKAWALSQIVERIDIDPEGRLAVTFTNLSHIPDLGIRFTGGVVSGGDARYTLYQPEEMRAILWEGKDAPVRAVCAKYGIGATTFYRWKNAMDMGDTRPDVSVVRRERKSKCFMFGTGQTTVRIDLWDRGNPLLAA